MKFETGAGKTTLGLLFLLYQGSKKVKSFYVNYYVDLCFRDYNRIAPIAQEFGLSVSYIASLDDLPKATNSDILFLKTSIYYDTVKIEEWKKAISESFLLLDEFDQTLFG
jgi:reverse gyrase